MSRQPQFANFFGALLAHTARLHLRKILLDRAGIAGPILADVASDAARAWAATMRERYAFARRVSADLATLGLSAMPDADGLSAAWRETASRTHPDHGGSAAEFQRAREAYARLRAVV